MNETLDECRAQLRDRTIFIVPYCHPDWAWTHTRRWHELRYILAMDEVLDILLEQDNANVPADAPEAFRWYMDCFLTQMIPYRAVRPERVDELRRRVAEGRVGVCGGYSNVRINHVEGETFIRGMVYGRRAFREVFPEADLSVHSDIVDIAVGYPQLPQLLRLAGYDYLQFWRPNDSLTAKGVPSQFRWRGLDGSEVLCSRGVYGDIVTSGHVPEDYADRWDQTVETWWRYALQHRAKLAPGSVIWVQHGADDNRPLRTHFVSDQPLDLPGLIALWNDRESSRMRFGTPVEVFRRLAEESGSLPQIEGTLDPCDVAYNAAWYGSHGLWKLRSDCARAVGLAEMAGALGLAGGCRCFTPDALQAETEVLWKSTLQFSAHAIQWLFQDDFDEQYAVAQHTLRAATQAQHERLRPLIRSIAAPADTAAVLFNPLSFARTITAPLRLTFVRGESGGVPNPLRLIDGNGAEIPYQILGEMHHGGVRWELDTLVQTQLPAGGWNVVRTAEEQPSFAAQTPEAADVIENEYLRLHFHLGRLMKIVDKATGVEKTAPEDTPFGHLRAYEVDTTKALHVGPIIGRGDARWTSWRITESGPVRWTMRSEGHAGQHPVALETSLYRNEPRIEFRAEIDWQGMDGFMASHVPYDRDGELWGDMPFCVERKPLQDEPYVGIERGRQGMFIAQSFVDHLAGGNGMAYISHDGDRYFIFDAETNSLAHILINSFRRPQNTWEQHINRQIEGVGHHEFTFSLLPHAGNWRDARLWQVAGSLRTKPLQFWPEGGGELPAVHSLFAVEPANVSLSACYVEDGRILLRVFENMGVGTEATIRLPGAAATAAMVNLEGLPVEGAVVACRGAELHLPLRPWQIVTVAVPLNKGE